MEKLLVCANGNDGQLPQLKLFCETLLDPKKGAYKGDICILTTGLSLKNQTFFEQRGIFIHLDKLKWLFDLPLSRKIAMFELISQERSALIESSRDYTKQSQDTDFTRLLNSAAIAMFKSAIRKDKHNELWEDEGRNVFATYRNKHFSKLGMLSFFELSRNNYDKILLCDGDMVFQRPVIDLFAEVDNSRIYVCDEVNSITPGTNIYRSNKLADRHPSIGRCLAMGKEAHELNVGVLLGKTETIDTLLRGWKKLMFDSGFEDLFVAHPTDFWHEQDFMRLYRDMNPTLFKSLTLEEIVHLCSLGHTTVSEHNGFFRLRSGGKVPIIVHFAGGTWSKYPAIVRSYTIES